MKDSRVGKPCSYARCGSSEEVRTVHPVMDMHDGKLQGLKSVVHVACAACGRSKGNEGEQ